ILGNLQMRTRGAGDNGPHHQACEGSRRVVKTDAIEGIIDDRFRFHYDMFADVLYIRVLSAEETASIGDLTDDGDILLRDEQTDQAVGVTIVSWWKRYGQ